MTSDEQLAIITPKQFLVSLTAQVKGFNAALITNGITISNGWIGVKVNNVPVKYQYQENGDLLFQVGDDGSGNGLKSFAVPANWMVA